MVPMNQKNRPDERIVMPPQARKVALATFPMSARLAQLLKYYGIRVFGELQGLSYQRFSKLRNCGPETAEEMRQLVHRVSLRKPHGRGPRKTAVADAPASSARQAAESISIPEYARQFSPMDLPISVRLAHVLQAKGVVRLADLQGSEPQEFKDLSNCGTRTLNELGFLIQRLAAGEFRPVTSEFSPVATAEVLCLADRAIADLPDRSREMLRLRLGGDRRGTWTLAEVAHKFGLTRERVRQITELALDEIKKLVGLKINAYLRGVATFCCEKPCPLSPALLSQWLAEGRSKIQFPPVFYVRFMGELQPSIPIWPRGQVASLVGGRAAAILHLVESEFHAGRRVMPLKDAWKQVGRRMGQQGPDAREFLEALKRASALAVDFQKPDEGTVRLRRLALTDAIKAVLVPSPRALTAEEIQAQAREKFGAEMVLWSARAVGKAFAAKNGVYLLGRRRYGLKRHFGLPEKLWQGARQDVHSWLKKEHKPISTADLAGAGQFHWAAQTNQYELAHVLREDERFVDLGRSLFSLAAWGMEQRPYIKDLVPKILAEAGQPMTRGQILEHLRRLRSVSPYSISGILSQHPLVRRFGPGRYGLKRWKRD